MPRIVDHDVRRQEIVEAAGRVLQRGGFRSLSMRALATELGLTHGALLRYFPNKDAIIHAAFESAFTSTEQRWSEESSMPPLLALRGMLREMMPTSEVTRAESRVLVAFWDTAIGVPTMERLHRDVTERWRDAIRDLLAAAQDRGEVNVDTDVEVIADELIWLMPGMQIPPLMGSSRATPERQWAVISRILASIGARVDA